MAVKKTTTKSKATAPKEVKAEEVVEDVKVQPEIDMTAMMEQMKAELMVELKEQARKELEEESKKSVVIDKAIPTRKVDIERFEQIPVMNVTSGQLIYISKKTGAEWEWEGFGDIEYLEFQELLSMKSGAKRFLDEPYMLILHDDAVNHLGLSKMYDNMVDLENIDDVLKLNQEAFEEVLSNSPKGVRHTIIKKIKDRVDNEEDISIKKVKYVNRKYNLDIGSRG